ncbi:MAG TPA: GNAT family N-acetyltransferase [Rugosimonospora sp.]|nr:GNAT family N-acetyltransferase [Rugosimonospora sp.]
MALSVRPAGPADMTAVRRVANGFDLLHDWPDSPDFLDCEREHGRLMLASEAEAAVGFGGVLGRGAVTHLGDLFVAPGHQSGGVGRALLDRLFDGTGARATFASADPRAVPLYLRYGMLPRCPLYYLAGPAPAGEPAVSTVDISRVLAADASACGGSREEVLRWYAALPGVRVHAGPDGYALAREVDGRVVLGPAGGGTAAGCARTVLATAAWYAGRPLRLVVFGPNPLLPRLLAAGLRIEDSDTYLATEADLLPVDRYLPGSDLG